MSTMKVSEYMLALTKELVETKKVADSTAAAYVRSLYILNGKKPFKTLTFLKKVEDIDKIVVEYAENTQKALYTAITSVLSLVKEKPTYKKVYSEYYDKMMGKAKEIRVATDSAVKTEKEEANWITWDDITKRMKELSDEVSKFAVAKHISPEQYDILLKYAVLSLYTDTQPRRNQDYMDMFVVRKFTDELPKDVNYLILDGRAPKEFVFNKYKTAKTYGQQRLPIPEALGAVLSVYLKHHPLNKGNKKSTPSFRFLVNADGSPLAAVNAITRILNKTLGKKVGSSMLRHIFLSSKYDVDDMNKDAGAMGHSVNEQKKYLKGSGKMPTLEVSDISLTTKQNDDSEGSDEADSALP